MADRDPTPAMIRGTEDMGSSFHHRTPGKRSAAAFQVLVCLLLLFQNSSLLADSREDPGAPQTAGASGTLAEIEQLKLEGEYEKAIALCRAAIAEFSDSDAVLREAYNYLVFLPTLMGEDSEEFAREALTRFPDLVAGDNFPDMLNHGYDGLRRRMYGSLVVNVEPDSSLVFLDGGFMGKAPLDIAYLSVGNHFIEVSHEGFEAHADSIAIEAGEQHVRSIILNEQGGGFPWLIAAAGAVVGVVVVLVSGGDDAPAADDPLPGPPEPPGK
jgi:hypothetical protein